MEGKLIIIAGVPCSGKTTLGKFLEERLRSPLISKDKIKEIMYDTIGFKSREEKVKLSDASTKIMYDFADELLSLGRTVILENNFENSSKDGLLILQSKHRCETVTIRLEGDLNVIYERFLARDKSPERHRGHVINTEYPEKCVTEYSPMLYESFVEMCKSRGIDSFEVPGKLIRVDVTELDKVSYEDILKNIGGYGSYNRFKDFSQQGNLER